LGKLGKLLLSEGLLQACFNKEIHRQPRAIWPGGFCLNGQILAAKAKATLFHRGHCGFSDTFCYRELAMPIADPCGDCRKCLLLLLFNFSLSGENHSPSGGCVAPVLTP